ncbi:MAG TPA: hypothetical protein VJX10_04435, partial [Pseudonocardiaceae bacterium]|nr:hypothetical protein [Pseudonocardiaceae bacterium]
MDTARTDRDVSRLLCRVLVVVGGAVVATVAAWLISSPSASADTLPDPVAAVGHALATVGVPQTVATPPVPVPLRHAPVQVAAKVGGVTSALSGAVSQLGHHVPPAVAVPVSSSRPVTTPAERARTTPHRHTQHAAAPIARHRAAPALVVRH